MRAQLCVGGLEPRAFKALGGFAGYICLLFVLYHLFFTNLKGLLLCLLLKETLLQSNSWLGAQHLLLSAAVQASKMVKIKNGIIFITRAKCIKMETKINVLCF